MVINYILIVVVLRLRVSYPFFRRAGPVSAARVGGNVPHSNSDLIAVFLALGKHSVDQPHQFVRSRGSGLGANTSYFNEANGNDYF